MSARRARLGRAGRAAAAVALSLAAGCTRPPQAPESERPARERSDRLEIVLLSDMASDWAESPVPIADTVRRIAEAGAPDVVILAGDYLRNDDPEALDAEAGALAAAIRPLNAPVYAVLGWREYDGSGPEPMTRAAAVDEVVRALHRAGLLPVEDTYYTTVLRPGLRLVVIDVLMRDPAALSRQMKWLHEALRRAPEDRILVCAFGPFSGHRLDRVDAHEDNSLADILAADARVAIVTSNVMAVEGWACGDAPIVSGVGYYADGAYQRLRVVRGKIVVRRLDATAEGARETEHAWPPLGGPAGR